MASWRRKGDRRAVLSGQLRGCRLAGLDRWQLDVRWSVGSQGIDERSAGQAGLVAKRARSGGSGRVRSLRHPDRAQLERRPQELAPVGCSLEAEHRAAQAGLQQGDIILSIDGQQLTGESSLGQVINQHKPGDTIQLSILRNGQPQNVRVTLGQAPS